MTKHFQPIQIEIDSPQWLQAVGLKRERAFSMLEKMDGLTRPEIEQRYASYQQEQGIGLHDQKLREEIMGGLLYGWWQAEKLMAYASVCEAELLGDKKHLVFNVLDVCLNSETTPDQHQAIIASLLAKAEEAHAFSVQMYSTPSLYEPIAEAGGISVKQWFQWPLRNRATV